MSAFRARADEASVTAELDHGRICGRSCLSWRQPRQDARLALDPSPRADEADLPLWGRLRATAGLSRLGRLERDRRPSGEPAAIAAWCRAIHRSASTLVRKQEIVRRADAPGKVTSTSKAPSSRAMIL
jgi:hypothetical protein